MGCCKTSHYRNSQFSPQMICSHLIKKKKKKAAAQKHSDTHICDGKYGSQFRLYVPALSSWKPSVLQGLVISMTVHFVLREASSPLPISGSVSAVCDPLNGLWSPSHWLMGVRTLLGLKDGMLCIRKRQLAVSLVQRLKTGGAAWV